MVFRPESYFASKGRKFPLESMTGYGRSSRIVGQKQIVVEIKSVNHRYLELSTRLPEALSSLDPAIRNLVRHSVSRGKTDLTIRIQRTGSEETDLIWDKGMAAFYQKAALEMAETLHLPDDLTTSRLLNMPGVILQADSSEDPDRLWEGICPVIEEALTNFHASRKAEGSRLAKDLLEKADTMASLVDRLEERAPELIENYRNRLYDKVKEVLDGENVDLDDNRIAAEVTIYADKICIDEEMVRLKSHVAALRKDLQSNEPVGRKLDFLVQEMNRESNTILSKSTDVLTADLGIEMKTLVEKIREQVQNIE